MVCVCCIYDVKKVITFDFITGIWFECFASSQEIFCRKIEFDNNYLKIYEAISRHSKQVLACLYPTKFNFFKLNLYMTMKMWNLQICFSFKLQKKYDLSSALYTNVNGFFHEKSIHPLWKIYTSLLQREGDFQMEWHIEQAHTLCTTLWLNPPQGVERFHVKCEANPLEINTNLGQKKKIIVWLSSTTFFWVGMGIFFLNQKSKIHWIIAS